MSRLVQIVAATVLGIGVLSGCDHYGSSRSVNYYDDRPTDYRSERYFRTDEIRREREANYHRHNNPPPHFVKPHNPPPPPHYRAPHNPPRHRR